jgi:hypothetical protein
VIVGIPAHHPKVVKFAYVATVEVVKFVFIKKERVALDTDAYRVKKPSQLRTNEVKINAILNGRRLRNALYESAGCQQN